MLRNQRDIAFQRPFFGEGCRTYIILLLLLLLPDSNTRREYVMPCPILRLRRCPGIRLPGGLEGLKLEVFGFFIQVLFLSPFG